MDMKQLFDDYRKHIESLDDDAIRQSIDRATGTYNEDKVNSIFEDIDNLTWYHINEHGEMEEGSNSDCETFYKAKDIFDVLAKYGYHERTMTDEVRNISSNQ